ncbi:IS4 family transposase [Novipirellula sp.]|jgi:hypothetical protein|uniref:Transposase DDE domain protein n=1 Tax=Stieleria magnilauensis TaxID=2527963 RepID=A0ABX5XIK5_9BACT|nr:Transposase DDE domain protein [Planctomycetes bacterium TBK1r]QDV81415.1 Transposase DDE domain protein [Planctomycetes bacterium TBK1r]QDV81509.1 Transposase DDE domain protein [Planctomycetes bacterium TBK1r]QDV81816.1 Transposase DDE domain protein [Planctomycetes bacterium TBK1r]QDV81817.1 Transposase DDE domain protein [Planctomycetes bacterium TBK1r]
MVDPTTLGADEESRFGKAKALLAELLELPKLQRVFEDHDCANARMVYTQAPTLWLLVLQRLEGGISLTDAVADLLKNHTDILPDNRRVQENRLSENNSAYNAARKRIPLAVVEEFSHRICDHLASRAPKAFLDRRVFIIDGTTITLPPTEALQKAFPPASNQHGETVWPIARLLVANEMQTGCALLPQVDPMYGADNKSELEQAKPIIERLPKRSIVLADSGFGIFNVAHHCQLHHQDFVLRLTKQRFRSYRKSATLVDQGDGYKTFHLIWRPTPKDRRTNLDLSKDTSIEVFLHQIELENGDTLEIVTSLETDAHSAAALYVRRYDVEFDIRDVKVTMDTENIRAKSVDTVMKELMGSIIAYNLVAQLRKQAAKLIRVDPRELSFTGVWTTFKHHLLREKLTTLEEWRLAYHGALVSAAGRKLPNRKLPRSYPRIAHPRRQKTTKFQKSLRRKKQQPDDIPPE